MIEIGQDDLYMMLLSTVRYSLGRSTYMSGVCLDLWIQYRSKLTDMQRDIVLRDVREAVMNAEQAGRTVGMRCDHESWRRFLELDV